MPELLSGLGDFHQVLFGAVLVLVVTLMPGGIMGGIAGMVRWTHGRARGATLKEAR
ncbi:hypothetical protein D3C72_2258610 [compost metagenome]